jgi:hypothetical protein
MAGRRLSIVFILTLSTRTASFNKPFYPQDSRPFDPSASDTFHLSPGEFGVKYADDTELQGLVGADFVQLGKYRVPSRFGVITKCNSPDFNGVDGILGLGLPPSVALSSTIPMPLLFQLSDKAKQNDTGAHVLESRVFAFLSTTTAGELQLGGVDPASIEGPLKYTPTIGSDDYRVPIFGGWYGEKSLFEFVPRDPRLRYLPAIIDSGSSCLILPDDTLHGLLRNRPYTDFVEARRKNGTSSFYLDVSGIKIEIPFDVWYLAAADKACVQKTPPGFPGVLLGDVLFRRYAVEFNLTNPKAVTIGIAPQKKGYKPVTVPTEVQISESARQIQKHPLHKTSVVPHREQATIKTVTNLPVINKRETQYFIQVLIGTPAVSHLVTFDTGSSVFGIFSKTPPACKIEYSPCIFRTSVFDRVKSLPRVIGTSNMATTTVKTSLLGQEWSMPDASGVGGHLDIVRQQLDQIASKIADSLLQAKHQMQLELAAPQGPSVQELKSKYLEVLLKKRAQLQTLLTMKCMMAELPLQSEDAVNSCAIRAHQVALT